MKDYRVSDSSTSSRKKYGDGFPHRSCHNNSPLSSGTRRRGGRLAESDDFQREVDDCRQTLEIVQQPNPNTSFPTTDEKPLTKATTITTAACSVTTTPTTII